jgi:hypothetical protein
MAAGVLRGAPVTTVDLDIVHRREAGNVSRLLQVLAELHAIYRHDPRGLAPAESHLMGEGHQLLTTMHGDLPTLIELKEKAGRPKDLAVLPVLRATLEEVRRREPG